MEHYITPENINEYLILPQNFDWDLVDQELGFGEIFEFIPMQIYCELKDSEVAGEVEIFRLLTKAATHYSFALSIPKIKVHITNYGVQQVNEDKTKTAPWWDVRDLGLSLLKFADKLFSEAITKLSFLEALKERIPFFENVSGDIKTPAEFEKIYSIKNSPKVFSLLQSFLEQSYALNILDKIQPDCLDQIRTKPNLYKILKQANVYYSLYYASLLPNFVFLQNAVAIQYEELPWQKSQVLSFDEKTMSGKQFLKLGDSTIKVITDYIKTHIDEFPCYSGPVPDRQIQAKASGIYLT